MNGEAHMEWVDSKEDWISEPVLWTPTWVHLGKLTAVTECEFLLVDAKFFGEIVNLNPPSFKLARAYARDFLRWLNLQARENLSDIAQGEIVGPSVQRMVDE